MTNTLGYRKVFAVLAPSTNTAVEADSPACASPA